MKTQETRALVRQLPAPLWIVVLSSLSWFSPPVRAGSEVSPLASVLLTLPDATQDSNTSGARTAMRWWFRGYRKTASKVRGPVCSFEPSCSSFSEQAIGKYGFARGMLMTGDRLQRCHYCLNPLHYPRGGLYTQEGWRFRDPIEDHALWPGSATPRLFQWRGDAPFILIDPP